MKKEFKSFMKLVWMVMFALPLVMFTSCGDDKENDEPETQTLFKDYSFLLRKTPSQVKSSMGTPDDADVEGWYYEVNKDNVIDLYAFFTDLDEDEYGEYEIYDTVQIVDVNLDEDVKSNDVQNLFNKKYDMLEVDEDGDYYYIAEKQKMGVVYSPSYNQVTYVNIEDDYGKSINKKALKQHVRSLRKK